MTAPTTPEPRAAEWQPISTAPKDGTHVLLWDGRQVQSGRADKDAYGAWMDTRGAGYEWDVWGHGELKPTHWRPLPDPPGATALSRAPAEAGPFSSITTEILGSAVDLQESAEAYNANPSGENWKCFEIAKAVFVGKASTYSRQIAAWCLRAKGVELDDQANDNR